MDYSRGEVAMLLGLRRDEAIECDQPRSGMHPPDGSSEEGPGRIPVLARWSEVHAASRRVSGRRAAEHEQDVAARAEIEATLTARGFTGSELAAGTSQQSVSRRSRSFVDDLVDELNGAGGTSGAVPGGVGA